MKKRNLRFLVDIINKQGVIPRKKSYSFTALKKYKGVV